MLRIFFLRSSYVVDMEIPILSKEEIALDTSIHTYVVDMKIPVLSKEEIALDTSNHTSWV